MTRGEVMIDVAKSKKRPKRKGSGAKPTTQPPPPAGA
jgi:hypothetical protein